MSLIINSNLQNCKTFSTKGKQFVIHYYFFHKSLLGIRIFKQLRSSSQISSSFEYAKNTNGKLRTTDLDT